MGKDATDGPMKSRIPGFYDLNLEQRRAALGLEHTGGLSSEQAESMIENAIDTFGLPLGIATNFIVNGRELLVPMAIEEPSVVAGASFMAKLVRTTGGFRAEADPSHMIGQIQLLDVAELAPAAAAVLEAKDDLLQAADAATPNIVEVGGGAVDVTVRSFAGSPAGPMLIVHVIQDTVDAMGANSVNSMLEAIAPDLERITGGRAHLRILSNLADRRLARASCQLAPETLSFDGFAGEQVRDGIVEAWAFAATDPYRAATHNKGIMNGIDAVVIATGNDWRAVEAGAHAYAARNGQYGPLSRWWVDGEGHLNGELELPLAVGTVGGATRVHPMARANLELMDIKRARGLAEVVVSVGLAQNLAALRALSTEGIQRGHMGLHARQMAMAAGAKGELVERIAHTMVDEGEILLERAQALLKQME
jgi:hydroxymethylglutaryl-CoA reductase